MTIIDGMLIGYGIAAANLSVQVVLRLVVLVLGFFDNSGS